MLYLFTFLLGLGIALYFTPLLRDAALRFGIVDQPDGRLKQHGEPVPYLGGVAVYLAFLFALALSPSWTPQTLGLLLGGTLMLLLGLIDDMGALDPTSKLFGQAVAVAALLKSGITIELTWLPWWASYPIAALWLLATCNAFNLIDTMDGLASSVALATCAGLFAVGTLTGEPLIAVSSAGLGGALSGFLRYNWHPAKIYLGDAGSLFLGLTLGALAMQGSYTHHNTVAALAPAILLGVPLFDMLFVMYIRRLRGLPLFLGSPDHVALRLRKWRLTTPQTVLANAVVAGALGLGAIVMMFCDEIAALIVLALMVVAAIAVAVFLRRIDMTL
ncbi:MAG TPA: MraY family glycosyltransferase [Acidobacteriota bacterium]